MTLLSYIEWKPNRSSVILVENANSIIEEYSAEGYVLTLRQLYYQFVSRDLIPNTEKSYKNLGGIITKARMAGLVSWTAIEDRNRSLKSFWFEENPLSAVSELPDMIRFNQWRRQEYYVEVWVEKEALGNVISRACTPYLVPHLSCKGYLSASEAWRAGRRFERASNAGKKCVMIHLGDHDPSGIDMTRDNDERLALFSNLPSGVDVRRIALNIDQVREYAPPPNPAKTTDSRASGYIKKYGRVSWELDALEPSIIEELITTQIKSMIDFEVWNQVEEEENEVKNRLSLVYDNWDEVEELINNL